VPLDAAALSSLRYQLTTSAGLNFASAGGGLLATWPLLLGCALGALLLACLSVPLLLYLPTVSYVLFAFLGTGGLICVSAISWTRGAERISLANSTYGENAGYLVSTSYAERDTGIALAVLSLVYLLAAIGFFFIVRPALRMFTPAARLLRQAVRA